MSNLLLPSVAIGLFLAAMVQRTKLCAVLATIKTIEHTLLPDNNNTDPPETVMRFITGKVKTRFEDERKHRHALKWLQAALSSAHLSSKIKANTKRLLSKTEFTRNMEYMNLFVPLQLYCKQQLLRIGQPLSELYLTTKDIRGLSNLHPLQQPSLYTRDIYTRQAGTCTADKPAALLRQDHPHVGLTAAKTLGATTFNDESMYIHFLRIVATLVNQRYQQKVHAIVVPLGGEHKSCSIKGDIRMRNKTQAKEDYRYNKKPRPAHNIDIVRCCVTFDTPASLRKGARALSNAFSFGATNKSRGVGRIKNGFALQHAEAAHSFHYRSFMMNILVDFGSTFRELLQEQSSKTFLQHYINAAPDNPKEPWGRWQRHAMAAVKHLTSEEIQKKQVRMVCEVQILLRPYLNARKQMHLMYKVVRAETAAHLSAQFAVSKTKGKHGRPKDATWKSEERRVLQATTHGIRQGKKMLLQSAIHSGFVSAVQLVLLSPRKEDVNQGDGRGLFAACQQGHLHIATLLLNVAGIDVNLTNRRKETALFSACQYGHVEIVQLLLARKDTAINKGNELQMTPLNIACYKGHFDVVKALLARNDISVNQPNSNGISPLFYACQGHFFDVVQVLLLVKGIDVNQTKKSGTSPLSMASERGFVDIVHVLLDSGGIDVDQADHDGGTAMFHVCTLGRLGVLLLLLDNGADVNKPLNDGQAPIFAAAENGHVDIVRVLVKAGANVNARVMNPSPIDSNASGLTPLGIAQNKKYGAIVKVLIEAGAGPD